MLQERVLGQNEKYIIERVCRTGGLRYMLSLIVDEIDTIDKRNYTEVELDILADAQDLIQQAGQLLKA